MTRCPQGAPPASRGIDRTATLKNEHRNLSQSPLPTQHPWVSFIHEATGWVAGLSEPALRLNSFRHLGVVWAGNFRKSPCGLPLTVGVREPVATAESIEKRAHGVNKGQAIGAYAVALAETDPATAVRWGEMLPSGDLRNNRTTKVLERWLDLNEKAARA